MAEKFRSILVRFRVGGFGGIRGPTIEEAVEALRMYGFSKELDKEVQKILKELRAHRNSKAHRYLIEEAEDDLLALLRNWQQRKNKKGEENAVSASK